MSTKFKVGDRVTATKTMEAASQSSVYEGKEYVITSIDNFNMYVRFFDEDSGWYNEHFILSTPKKQSHLPYYL